MKKTPALEKIKDFIFQKNLSENMQEIPEHGRYTINMGYDLATNSKYPDMIFVLYKSYSYKNHSILNLRWCVHAFDVNTGEEIKGFEKSNKCYDGFYNESQLVQELI
jgi:hypothetical protein